MPKLVAKERFYYDGRMREVGEEFNAYPQDAALLTHAMRPMAMVVVENEEPKAKRKYARRDMTAEDSE